MNIRGLSSSPRILTIFGKVTRQMTTLTLVFVRTVSSFMRTLTDGTLKGLTSVPHPTRIPLDIALKRDVLLQRHTNNSSASGNLLKARKMLLGNTDYFAKGQKRQMDTNIISLRRQIVDINQCYW